MFGFIDFNFILGICLHSLLLFQPFNISPVSVACSFQEWVCAVLHWHEIDFLSKKCQIDPLVSLLWRLVTQNADTFKFESSQSEESRASDVASQNFLEVPNIFTLSEERYLVWYNTSRSTKWKDMPEAWKETMAPRATPMSRTQSVDSLKAWRNLENLELLIFTW